MAHAPAVLAAAGGHALMAENAENERDEPIIGIDLGTTNSLAAFADVRGPRTLGSRATGGDSDGPAGDIIPSVVRYEPAADGSLSAVVGETARDAAMDHPLHTITSVKRLMGRSHEEAADAGFRPYAIVAGERAMAAVAIPMPDGTTRIRTPQEVSADILRAVRARAEHALGRPVRRAVVTVPAYFDDPQRQATRDAGRLAGLEVVRIVSEPTAAALAYGLGAGQRAKRQPSTVAIYDLGGGTFDVSILRITPGAAPDAPAIFQVLAVDGDTRLGGDDADHLLVDLFVREMDGRLGLGLPEAGDRLGALPPDVRRALVGFAQGVKHRLSEQASASISIDVGGRGAYEREVTREEFEALIQPWIDRSIRACERARHAAKKKPGGDAIDAVVLVGGSTRIPAVRRAVAEGFGLEPYTALDPDRVVALGAAVQASILQGTSRGSLLLDAIPLGLGIETVGGAVAKLIVANSTVPARATETFSTSVDNQTAIVLRVRQGEREMAEDCRLLGEFHLRGIPPMPAGVPQLQVEFLVDANGVLSVSAVEQRSGQQASLQIVPNHGLTSEEVDRIEAEALEHARDDMARHRVVDLVSHSKLDLKWIDEAMARAGDAIDAAVAQKIASAADGVRELIRRAEADWRSVEPESFARAKQAMDEASVPLHEASIARSLRGTRGDG
ncbi:MAG: Hsp70 family protein [Planctomycetota bacterium]